MTYRSIRKPRVKIQGHKLLGRKMENVAGVLVKDVAAKLGRSSRAQAEM